MRRDEITTLIETLGLKRLPRSGWVRAGVSEPESVAAHSWGVSWLVLVFLPPELDRARALTYAVLHDLPEVRVGDLTPHDGIAPLEKARREHQAMASLCASVPGGGALLLAWEAYERQADPEARFVKQLDRVDMALQAVFYGREGTVVDEFLASARAAVSDPRLITLVDLLASPE